MQYNYISKKTTITYYITIDKIIMIMTKIVKIQITLTTKPLVTFMATGQTSISANVPRFFKHYPSISSISSVLCRLDNSVSGQAEQRSASNN